MSIVTPTIISTGGSIHLQYAPGGIKGVSNKVTISLTLDISLTTDSPPVILELELPGNNFQFNNNSNAIAKDCGIMSHGEAINYEFVIVCKIPNPSTDMVLILKTRDEGAPLSDARSITVPYSVKISQSTAQNVRIAFLSN